MYFPDSAGFPVLGETGAATAGLDAGWVPDTGTGIGGMGATGSPNVSADALGGSGATGGAMATSLTGGAGGVDGVTAGVFAGVPASVGAAGGWGGGAALADGVAAGVPVSGVFTIVSGVSCAAGGCMGDGKGSRSRTRAVGQGW